MQSIEARPLIQSDSPDINLISTIVIERPTERVALLGDTKNLNFLEKENDEKKTAEVTLLSACEGNTTLHKECFLSNADQVIDLLSKGASVNVYNKDGNSPLHLALLSPFAVERIKDVKIQVERVEKIRLIIEKLIERGADLNITNKKLQTPLFLIVNLGFEKLRIEIGKLMFSNRGEISRGWIRYHIQTALSLYQGDFHHTGKDQHLLDHHVSSLTGFSFFIIFYLFYFYYVIYFLFINLCIY